MHLKWFVTPRAGVVNFSPKNWPEMTDFDPFVTSSRQLQQAGKWQLLNSALQHAILGEEVEFQNKISERL